jgi:hypothetical protein
MDITKDFPIVLVKNIELKISSAFSINSYLEQNGAKFGSIVNGMNDENFALENDFYGNINFCIFKMKENIYSTTSFLRQARFEGYLLTGVKGIASILLKPEELLFIDSWLLSPHKILEYCEKWTDGIPYLGIGKDKDYSLHFSNHSVNDLRSGMYILLAESVQ